MLSSMMTRHYSNGHSAGDGRHHGHRARKPRTPDIELAAAASAHSPPGLELHTLSISQNTNNNHQVEPDNSKWFTCSTFPSS